MADREVRADAADETVPAQAAMLAALGLPTADSLEAAEVVLTSLPADTARMDRLLSKSWLLSPLLLLLEAAEAEVVEAVEALILTILLSALSTLLPATLSLAGHTTKITLQSLLAYISIPTTPYSWAMSRLISLDRM